MREIKEGDVFDFRYKPEVLEDLEKRWYRGYPRYVLKKGAKKLKDRMLETINEQLREAHSDLASAARCIELLAADRQKIESGDLQVYL